jgi:hypothetical protein
MSIHKVNKYNKNDRKSGKSFNNRGLQGLKNSLYVFFVRLNRTFRIFQIHRQNVVSLLFSIICSSFAGAGTTNAVDLGAGQIQDSPLPGQKYYKPQIVSFSRMLKKQAVDFGLGLYFSLNFVIIENPGFKTRRSKKALAVTK